MLANPTLRVIGAALAGAAIAFVGMSLWRVLLPREEADTSRAATPQSLAPAQREPNARFPDDTSETEVRQELTRLRADIAALRKEVEYKLDASRSKSANEAEHASAEVDFVPDAEADLETELAEEERQIQERAKAIEAKLEAEALDGAWSGSASDLLRGAFADEQLAEASPQDIECRTTLCRVEVRHRDEAKLGQFQRVFPSKVASMFPRLAMHRIKNPDGSLTTYVYLARQGHRLPTVEHND